MNNFADAHMVGAVREPPLRKTNEESQGLPEGWKRVPFGKLCKVQGGYAFKSSWFKQAGVPLVRISNLVNGVVQFDENTVYLDQVILEQYADVRLNKGDSLIAMSGATTGKMAVYSLDQGALLNQRVGRFKIQDENIVDKKYISYLVNQIRERVIADAYGAAQPNISPKQIEEIEVPLAPLPIQKLIVAEIEKQFSRLDEAMAGLKRVQANLKRYKASVLKAAVEGRLTEEWRKQNICRGGSRTAPTECESGADLLKRILAERRAKWEEEQISKMRKNPKNVGAIHELPLRNDAWKKKYKEPAAPDTASLPKLPQGWVWGTAEQCTSLITDGEHATPERSNEGVYLLSARNIHDGKVLLDDVDYIPEHVYKVLANRFIAEPGDVLLSCSGSVGRSCVAPMNLKFAMVRSVAILKPLLDMGQYISYAIRSTMVQAQINELKSQTAQANIFQGAIKRLIFPVPPIEERKHIIEEVDRRLSLAEEIEAVIETNLKRAERMRQAILKKAFEGRLVA